MADSPFDVWRRMQPSGDERFPYDIAKAAFKAGFDAGHEAAADAMRGYCTTADEAWSEVSGRQGDKPCAC